MSDLRNFRLGLPGGINQSAPVPSEQDWEELKNLQIYRARLGLRAPLSSVIATLQDDQGTPANVTSVVALADHDSQLWAVSHSTNTNKVYLHSMDYDGSNLTQEGIVWTGVSSAPVVSLASFTGGTATSGLSRLYIADYDQNENTRFWNGSTLNELADDLDNDDSKENFKFSLVIPYKFHLWGTGFFEGTTTRPEMLRFSQPGLIPGNDTSGENPKEWHSTDHRSVGRRGEKIRAVTKAGDRLIVLQKNATHAIFGTGAATWTTQQLSDTVGCVGPKAATTVNDRVAYFWSGDGPYRTDGSQVQSLSEPIEDLVTSVDAAEADTVVSYDPVAQLVRFVVSDSGADQYSLELVFSHRHETWLKAEHLVGGSTQLEFGSAAFADDA